MEGQLVYDLKMCEKQENPGDNKLELKQECDQKKPKLLEKEGT
jgi:hypothetical protein